MEHQIHYDKKFYQDKKSGYWISTNLPRIRAHAWVWKCHFGEIQKGMHIHHIDGNKSNNDVSNLQCLTVKEHYAQHDSPERSIKTAERAARIRLLAKEWHGSEQGLEWHRGHGLKTWEERKPFEQRCKHCSKVSMTKVFHQDFCSNSCKSAWRRKDGRDNEERCCPICSNKFTVNKYARSKTCGRKCGRVLLHKKH